MAFFDLYLERSITPNCLTGKFIVRCIMMKPNLVISYFGTVTLLKLFGFHITIREAFHVS